MVQVQVVQLPALGGRGRQNVDVAGAALHRGEVGLQLKQGEGRGHEDGVLRQLQEGGVGVRGLAQQPALPRDGVSDVHWAQRGSTPEGGGGQVVRTLQCQEHMV